MRFTNWLTQLIAGRKSAVCSGGGGQIRARRTVGLRVSKRRSKNGRNRAAAVQSAAISEVDVLEQRLLLTAGDEPDRFEPNQDFDQATHLTNCGFDCSVGATEHAGRVRYDDLTIHAETIINYDQDYYQFFAHANGSATVDIEFSDADMNLDLYIYDSNEDLITSSTSNTDDESVTFNVTSGSQYFI